MAGEASRVEQWIGIAMTRELGLDSGQERGIARQLQRQRLVFLEVGGNQLRKTDRLQQTGCHPPRKCLALAGQHGQPRP